ncbi:MAG: ATP-binding protein [Eubacterium sp.]|nr:ATP-binding protein [Eubacterium sp.]
MNNIVSNLLLYGDLPEDSILMELSEIFSEFNSKKYDADDLRARVYHQVKRILDVSTDYGFDDNLWHNYLTYLLITTENSFSLTCEKVGASEGSVNDFAKNDFKQFKKLFDFDFKKIEKELDIDCFSKIEDYTAIHKPEFMYNKNVSEKVRSLSKKLEETKDENEFFDAVSGFYKDYGVGMFGLNKAFRLEYTDGELGFKPINNMEQVTLDDLVGYDIQKKKLIDNTDDFVEGRRCNNCLLFGDSGTGKSTSIKAIVNQYYDRGLRMIEIYKHQFKDLSNVIATIKNRNYKFIIYMDDLSFEDFETEYKFLKAVIEGGVETKPDNILIYATSNRRHIIKEKWSDRDDMIVEDGLHQSDTMEEKLSLVYRFGVTISFSKPSQKEYFEIAKELCKREGVELPDKEIEEEANKWELAHGGLSGRTARQFANYMAAKQEKE